MPTRVRLPTITRLIGGGYLELVILEYPCGIELELAEA
jgi:hypothetical protein